MLANKTPTFVPPSSEELSCAMTVGIDAEFVALTAEETGPVALVPVPVQFTLNQ